MVWIYWREDGYRCATSNELTLTLDQWIRAVLRYDYFCKQDKEITLVNKEFSFSAEPSSLLKQVFKFHFWENLCWVKQTSDLLTYVALKMVLFTTGVIVIHKFLHILRKNPTMSLALRARQGVGVHCNKCTNSRIYTLLPWDDYHSLD